jgi:hypothetical protein
MTRDHASAEDRFRCLYAEHVDPILRTGRRGSVERYQRILSEELLYAPRVHQRRRARGPDWRLEHPATTTTDRRAEQAVSRPHHVSEPA